MTPKLGLTDKCTSCVLYFFKTSWLANVLKIFSRSYVLIISRMKRIELPWVFAVISYASNTMIDSLFGKAFYKLYYFSAKLITMNLCFYLGCWLKMAFFHGMSKFFKRGAKLRPSEHRVMFEESSGQRSARRFRTSFSFSILYPSVESALKRFFLAFFYWNLDVHYPFRIYIFLSEIFSYLNFSIDFSEPLSQRCTFTFKDRRRRKYLTFLLC